MDYLSESKQYIRELSRIAGLVMDEDVKLHIEAKCTNKQLQILHEGGFIADKEILREFLPEEQIDSIKVQMKKESTLKRIAIMDVLGIYNAQTQTIVIYEVLCKLVAYSLRCNLANLISVVLAHEAAHAVTHLGVDHEIMIWDNFELASNKEKELFAQIYPYKLWKNNPSKDSLLETFMRLETNQPDIYHAWRIFENSNLNEINKALYKARRCQQACDQSDNQNNVIIERIVEKVGGYAPLTGEEIADTISDETEINIIPSSDRGSCTPLLVTCIGTNDSIELRILETLKHCYGICPEINKRVLFVATKWDISVWKKHRSAFSGLIVQLLIIGLPKKVLIGEKAAGLFPWQNKNRNINRSQAESIKTGINNLLRSYIHGLEAEVYQGRGKQDATVYLDLDLRSFSGLVVRIEMTINGNSQLNLRVFRHRGSRQRFELWVTSKSVQAFLTGFEYSFDRHFIIIHGLLKNLPDRKVVHKFVSLVVKLLHVM